MAKIIRGENPINKLYTEDTIVNKAYRNGRTIFQYVEKSYWPDNEIIYTSIHERVINPHTHDFGANIKSNTYMGGRGVIKFDGPVTKIGQDSYHEDNLLSIKLPKTVTEIGFRAFYYVSLRSIEIPENVTTIGDAAFIHCEYLESITCLATTPPTLGVNAFGDTNNCPIYVPMRSINDYLSAWSVYADRIQPIDATDIPLKWIGNGDDTTAAQDVFFGTGVVFSGNLATRAIKVVMSTPKYPSSAPQQVICGAYNNQSQMCRLISNQGSEYRSNFGSYEMSYSPMVSSIGDTVVSAATWVYSNKCMLKINDTNYSSSQGLTPRNGCGLSILLFAQAHPTDGINAKCYGGTKLYEAVLFNNCTPTATGFTGTPTKKFVPVLHWTGTEVKPCFKDKIGGGYIYNLGTGQLTYEE